MAGLDECIVRGDVCWHSLDDVPTRHQPLKDVERSIDRVALQGMGFRVKVF
jgi:hypothetical protein